MLTRKVQYQQGRPHDPVRGTRNKWSLLYCPYFNFNCAMCRRDPKWNPSGANWHQELLNQMMIEVPGIRPAVISSVVKDQLEEYRGFRHIVRNVYAYHFNPENIENLVAGLTSLFSKFDAELKSFAVFLRNVD